MISQKLKLLAAPMLIAGGLTWIATTIISILIGMLTGEVNPFPDAHSPLIVYIGICSFPLGTLLLSLAWEGFLPVWKDELED